MEANTLSTGQTFKEATKGTSCAFMKTDKILLEIIWRFTVIIEDLETGQMDDQENPLEIDGGLGPKKKGDDDVLYKFIVVDFLQTKDPRTLKICCFFCAGKVTIISTWKKRIAFNVSLQNVHKKRCHPRRVEDLQWVLKAIKETQPTKPDTYKYNQDETRRYHPILRSRGFIYEKTRQEDILNAH
ncbi:hypothetical protein Tco_0729282 [Tanacetum coccineum]|uniref:Uncharacterized protein n=1 Tax=Tanacetum coccineum TaxID=301880 RepID=A0ABQ4YPL2_9ASTR